MGMGLRIRLGVGFVGQRLGGLGFRIRVNCLGLWGWGSGLLFRDGACVAVLAGGTDWHCSGGRQ